MLATWSYTTGGAQSAQDTGITADLTDITWDGATYFVAAASDGVLRRSVDGAAWTTLAITKAGLLRAVAVHGATIVVVGENGVLVQSLDRGQTWQSIPVQSGLQDVAWTGNAFMAVGNGGRMLISGWAYGWRAVSTGVESALRSVASGPRMVVVGDGGTILVSTNGQSWERRMPARPLFFQDVIWTGSTFIAVADVFPPNRPIFLSSDGIEWTPPASVENLGAVWGIQSVAWSGTCAVATATAYGSWDGSIPQHGKVYASDDLQNWRIVHETYDSYAAAQVFRMDGEFRAVYSDEVLRSADGENWTSEPLSSFPFLWDVYGIAVVDDYAYGMTWDGHIRRSSDLKGWFDFGRIDRPGVKTDITWTGTGFLVCGHRTPDRVWWSSDGKLWQAMNPGTTLDLWGIASSDERWVVVGEDGTVRTRELE